VACALAWERGARLFRVHDAALTREALQVAGATTSAVPMVEARQGEVGIQHDTLERQRAQLNLEAYQFLIPGSGRTSSRSCSSRS